MCWKMILYRENTPLPKVWSQIQGTSEPDNAGEVNKDANSGARLWGFYTGVLASYKLNNVEQAT